MKLFTICLIVAAAISLAGCHSTGPITTGPQDQAVQTPIAPLPQADPEPVAPSDTNDPNATPRTGPRDPYAVDQFISPEEKVQLATANDATRAQIMANARERQNEALEYKRGMDRDWQDNRTMGKSLQNWSISNNR